jgi:hypothetical protein
VKKHATRKKINRTPRGTCYNSDFISKILLEGAGEQEKKEETAVYGQAGGEEYTMQAPEPSQKQHIEPIFSARIRRHFIYLKTSRKDRI